MKNPSTLLARLLAGASMLPFLLLSVEPAARARDSAHLVIAKPPYGTPNAANAQYAKNSGFANGAGYANDSGYARLAHKATTAGYAGSAGYAASAGKANYASRAGTAGYADGARWSPLSNWGTYHVHSQNICGTRGATFWYVRNTYTGNEIMTAEVCDQ